jgi:hypothetical protein
MRRRGWRRAALGALLALASACSSSNADVKRDGAAGSTGTGGAAGSTGSGGTGPCSGICANPITISANAASGDIGTGATCHEVAGATGSVVCGNFAAARTFTINGMVGDCPGGGGARVLPEARNGGWCIQAGEGDYAYAYFATFNIQ